MNDRHLGIRAALIEFDLHRGTLLGTGPGVDRVDDRWVIQGHEKDRRTVRLRAQTFALPKRASESRILSRSRMYRTRPPSPA